MKDYKNYNELPRCTWSQMLGAIALFALLALLIILVFSAPGCGNGSCDGVDTSQAPTNISQSRPDADGHYSETRYWGDCSRTYFY